MTQVLHSGDPNLAGVYFPACSFVTSKIKYCFSCPLIKALITPFQQHHVKIVIEMWTLKLLLILIITLMFCMRFSQQQKKEKKKKKIGLHSKIRVVSVWVMMPESLRTMSEPKRDRQLDTSGRNTYRTDKENQDIMG